MRRLRELGIDAPTVPYPAHRTVEEGKELRGEMTGTLTKNLLLRDRRLVTAVVDASLLEADVQTGSQRRR